MRPGLPAPNITVIVPSVNGLGDLRGCLLALVDGVRGVVADVIVVDRLGPAVGDAVRREFPSVRVIDVPRTTTIPEMRKLAFEAAAAPAVAVIEDHVLVPADWAARMLDALSEAGVVGGGVANVATERVIDWAAYLCEYSHLLPPLPVGPVDWLTGNNTIYRRDLVLRHRQVLGNGYWEHHLHDALKRSGVALYSRPDIVVGHKKHYTFGEYFSQRYLYARSYAGVRVASRSGLGRLVYGIAAMALPPVLFWRVVSRTWRRGGHRAELLRSVPLLGAFVCAWAAGEVIGAWRGAGDSLSRVC